MKVKLKTWLKQKVSKRRKKLQSPPHEGRFEGLTRRGTHRRAIKPSTSIDNLTSTPGAKFYTKLPAELRFQILTLAFGNRTVHMDLSFVHPVAARLSTEPPIRGHAGIHIDTRSSCPPTVKWDRSVPKSWKWWGCVCHRQRTSHLKTHTDRLRQIDPGPAGDYCCFGGSHHCADWPGEFPLKCKIGAMGWLLSCRQALVNNASMLPRPLVCLLTSHTDLQLHRGHPSSLQNEYHSHVWKTTPLACTSATTATAAAVPYHVTRNCDATRV